MKHHALRFFAFLLLAPALRSEPPPAPAVTHLTDVVYGRKFGVALTMDVFKPTQNANGAGVIWVVSGGWVSAHTLVETKMAFSPVQPLLKRGYTVFAVVHGCQPKFTIPEILTDMHRALRFIRHNAKEYGIDPNRIGVYG